MFGEHPIIPISKYLGRGFLADKAVRILSKLLKLGRLTSKDVKFLEQARESFRIWNEWGNQDSFTRSMSFYALTHSDITNPFVGDTPSPVEMAQFSSLIENLNNILQKNYGRDDIVNLRDYFRRMSTATLNKTGDYFFRLQ